MLPITIAFHLMILFSAPSEPAQETLLRQILEEQGILRNMRSGLEAQIEVTRKKNPWLPPETIDALDGAIQEDRMVRDLLPVWSKKFSTQEMQEILRFSKSPAGRKYLQISQRMNAESGLILSLYGLSLYKVLVQRHPDKFKPSPEMENQILEMRKKLEKL